MKIKSKLSGDDQSCLSQAQLVGYYEKTLSLKEKELVENHLKDCPLCSDALEGLDYLADVTQLESHLDAVKKRVRNKMQSSSTAAYRKYAIAAVLILAVFSIVYMIVIPPNSDAIFMKYYENFPNTIPIVRGDDFSDTLNDAMLLYEKKDYSEADLILDDLIRSEQNNLTACFYSGLTKLSLNESRLAANQFEKLLGSEDAQLKEHAQWYLALSLLKAGDIESARHLLQNIIKSGTVHMNNSAALLQDLSN